MSAALLPSAPVTAQPREEARSPANVGLWPFLLVQLFAVVWLQKIAIPGVGLDITLIFMAAGIVLLTIIGRLQVSPKRLALYAIFALTVIATQLMGGQPFSSQSVFLLVVAYLPIVMRFEISWSLYLRVIRWFIVFGMMASLIVLVEDGWQYARGAAVLPSMDRLLPQAWIIQGYTYVQPIYWGSAYIKPNAFFFREVSFVSQYCALALVLEVVFFRRIPVMILLLASIFASFAGTGLLLLALVTPFLFTRLPMKSVVALALVGVFVVGAAVSTGWLENVQRRLTETSDPNSSASMRFIYPLKLLKERIGVETSPFIGVGAGNVYKEVSGKGDLLPVTKLSLEFGLLATAAYYLMLIYCLLDGAPSRRVALALFILLNLCGPYLEVSTIVFLVMLLGTAMRPVGDRRAPLGARGLSPAW